jgi:hypothetical protein
MTGLRPTVKSLETRSKCSQSGLNVDWALGLKIRTAIYGLSIVFWVIAPGLSCAQDKPGLAGEEKLIAEFTDPLTTLPQISIKDAFTPANFGTHVKINQFIVGQSFQGFHDSHCSHWSN